MRRLLIIAGPLSGYSVALYRLVSRKWLCDIHLIHEPLPMSVSFSHERVAFEGFSTLDWTTACIPDVARYVRSCRPDAVVIHGTRPARAITAALAVLPKTVPILYVCDTNIYDLGTERRKLLPRIALYKALFSRVRVSLSLGWTNELALRLLGASHIEPIPAYAIDFEALDRAGKQQPQLAKSNALRMVIIARHVEVKNLRTAIEAVSSDPVLRAGLLLDFIGDGPLRADLEALTRKHDLQAIFRGALPRSQVGMALAHADALLLPSKYEPWGIVVCEALGMGIPVIASPAVGAAISLAGLSGAVAISRSPSTVDLADAIRGFLDRSQLLGAAARHSAPRVRGIYSLPDVASRLAALLENLAQSPEDDASRLR